MHYAKELFRSMNEMVLHLPIGRTPENMELAYDRRIIAEIMEIIFYITHVLRMTF